MYVHLSIKTPNSGQEANLIDSMHRFAAAARTQSGLQLITTLKDDESGDLVGLAVWDSEEALGAAIPTLRNAVAGDDFSVLEASSREFDLTEV